MTNPLIGKEEADQIVTQCENLCACGHEAATHRYLNDPSLQRGPCMLVMCDCEQFRNASAVSLGRLGGSAGKGVTSERKSASSRANMQKAAQASAAKKRAKKANPQP